MNPILHSDFLNPITKQNMKISEDPDVLAPRLLYYDRKHHNKPIELKWNDDDFSSLGKGTVFFGELQSS